MLQKLLYNWIWWGAKIAGNFSIDHSRITAGGGIQNSHCFYPRQIGLNLMAT
jgi:hypothetical protein